MQKVNGFLHEKKYGAFKKRLNELWRDMKDVDFDALIEKAKVMDELVHDLNILVMVFDMKNYKPLFLGKNAEKFSGYGAEEILAVGTEFLFKMLHPDDLGYPSFSVYSRADFVNKIKGNSKFERVDFFAGGFRIIHKKGHVVKVLSRQIGSFDNKEFQLKGTFYILNDVTHLLKDDFFWVRGIVEEENDRYSRFYTNKGGETNIHKDILTERELEILKLIKDGKSTRDISSELFVSPATIEKHRKNMIARIGAKDTTALIEICRLCDVL